jgi:hypothetical protein
MLLPALEPGNVYAENTDTLKNSHFRIISVYGQYGKVLATNPYLKLAHETGDTNIQYDAFSFQFLKQTAGENEWEKQFGYPAYGAGIYTASFFDNKGFGAPIAFYGVLKGPFKRWQKLTINYDTGFGLAFNWNSYNPTANNFNISLGANETVFIDLGFNLKYPLGKHLDLSLGYSFTHFSNGALKVPNFGLNTFSPKITLEYQLNRFAPKTFVHEEIRGSKKTSLDLSFFGGVKNVVYTNYAGDSIPNYRGVYYPIYGVNAVINKQVTFKSKIGIGTSVIYDGSYNSLAYVDHGVLESPEGFQKGKISLSIYPSYELVIHRLSVVVQPGFYVFRQQSTDKKPMTYQRLGLHYLVSKNLFAGICLHAYDYHVSDFIEWTLGYSFPIGRNPQP